MTGNIVTITLNPALDVTTDIEALVPRKKLRCAAPRIEPGGGGINVSRAIRELGGQSHAFVMLAGATGAQYRTLLDQTGIAFTAWTGTGETRTSITVMEARSGEHFRFVFPGPTQSSQSATPLLHAIQAVIAPPCRYVVISGSLPPGLGDNFYGQVARHCRDNGLSCVLDTSGPALGEALGGQPFLIKLNHHEARELAGGPSMAEASAFALGQFLRTRHGIDIVIITLGAEGAVLVSPNEQIHIRPPKMMVQSTVGAGDSFVAALVLRLQAGDGLAQACRFGVAAAASAVTTPASQLCRKDQTEAIYHEIVRSAA